MKSKFRDEFEALSKEVNAFSFYYKTLRYLYLEATDEDYKCYDTIAPMFFDRHHNLLLERLYMGFRHFTDRPEMRGRENLSFRYFAEHPELEGDKSHLLSQVQDFEDTVEPIKKTLHRKLGHLDSEMRRGLEKPTWLERESFEDTCSKVFTITNSIALLGWSFSIEFIDPNQNCDLFKLKRQLKK